MQSPESSLFFFFFWTIIMAALYVSQNDMSVELEILNATTDHCRHDLFWLILNRHVTTAHSPYKTRQELSSTSCESRRLCVRCGAANSAEQSFVAAGLLLSVCTGSRCMAVQSLIEAACSNLDSQRVEPAVNITTAVLSGERQFGHARNKNN